MSRFRFKFALHILNLLLEQNWQLWACSISQCSLLVCLKAHPWERTCPVFPLMGKLSYRCLLMGNPCTSKQQELIADVWAVLHSLVQVGDWFECFLVVLCDVSMLISGVVSCWGHRRLKTVVMLFVTGQLVFCGGYGLGSWEHLFVVGSGSGVVFLFLWGHVCRWMHSSWMYFVFSWPVRTSVSGNMRNPSSACSAAQVPTDASSEWVFFWGGRRSIGFFSCCCYLFGLGFVFILMH